MRALGWSAVTAKRVQRHALDVPSRDLGPAGVTAAIGAVHAQVMSAAELSLARRVAGATRADVARALWDERSIVKTFGPRGTVHLLATADLPMWTGALSALPSGVPRHPDPVRFSDAEADEVIAAIGDALADAELTVDELTAAIEARTGAWAVERTMDAFQDKWPRWRQLTSTAAQRGALCFGPDHGRLVTYTSPRRWLPGFEPMPAEPALRAVVQRYLGAFGPATPEHVARWLAVPVRPVAELFVRMAAELEAVTVDGLEAWMVAGDTAVPAEPARGVRLLPYFDAYVVGGQPREWLFPGPAATRALAGGQAGNFPVLLVDGLAGGVWHGKRSGRRLAITVEPLRDLAAREQRELEAEVALVGAIVGAEATLTVGPVNVGPHA